MMMSTNSEIAHELARLRQDELRAMTRSVTTREQRRRYRRRLRSRRAV
jgi:hypothetical protein